MVKAKLLSTPLLLALLAACSTPEVPADLSPQEKDGRALFARHCAACHSVSGDAVLVGPPLSGIATIASSRVNGLDAAAYLQQSIDDPNAYLVDGFADLMPPTLSQILSAEEVQAIVAYMLTLE